MSIENKTVVVIDIFRASSAICAAIDHGVKKIIPVKSLEEAREYKDQGYITAAERQGEIVEGFDFGNSPFAFMREDLKGKTIVLTTTNCTTAIVESSSAHKLIIGSFINISSITAFLQNAERDVVLLCAGWKNCFNLEDTLYAGALIQKLAGNYLVECDSAFAAARLYELAKNDLHGFLKNSSHARRLNNMGIEEDIKFCLTPDQTTAIPYFNQGAIEKLAFYHEKA